jgi:hypothetical protein
VGDPWLGATLRTHDNAQTKCEELGGHLVIYDNYIEQYEVGGWAGW